MATPVEAAFWTFSGNLEILNKHTDLVAQRQQRVVKLMRRPVSLARTAVIGSYHRNTIIRPLDEGDVDLMVLLDFGKYKRWLNPEGIDRIQERFATGLAGGRRKAGPLPVGRHALHVQLPEFRLDVMPAISSPEKGFMVPDFIQRTWINMHPPAFDRQVSDLDERYRQRVVPFIRILKAWNREAGSPLRGFHLECLVVRFIGEGWPIQEYSRAVADFFRWLQTTVSRPSHEPILGTVIDAYLDEGDVWTNKRRNVVTVVADTSRQIDEAVARATNQEWNTALDKWQLILGPYFPAY